MNAVVSRQFYAAPARVLYWKRRGRLPTNVVISATTASCSFANPYLIDRYGASCYHPAWFARDGYHLTASGQTAYASLVARRVAAVP